MRLRWLLSALMLASILFGLVLYIFEHDLFWRLRWIDIPAHILGGVTLGVFVAVLIGTHTKWYWPLLFVLFIAWEVFEFYGGLPQPDSNYPLDTLYDFINDVIGAGVIFYIARGILWRSN